MERDPYDDISPEDLPPLPPITDEEAAEMAEEWEGDGEPSDIDSDDYWTDHDPFGGGSMDLDVSVWDSNLIGGDSDLGGEY